MKKSNITYFWTVLILFVFIVFLFNSSHINQQGTYNNIFKPIAENLLVEGVYTCPVLVSEPLLYPFWGYAFLIMIGSIIGYTDIFILVIQYLLCLTGISLFYKIYKIKPKYRHIPLFLPYVALMSVKWPDAIVGGLLIIYVFFAVKSIVENKTKYFIISGIILGIVLNFRSEYLYLPLVFLLFLLLPHFKQKRKEVIKLCLSSFLISILLLLPWAIRSNSISNEYRFSATNGGAVMYISLGQLPGNKWGIVPLDQTAYNISDSLGFSSPYSPKADNYFLKKSKQLVSNNPGEYAIKAGYNFLSAWTRGVYTGEYANFFITKDRRKEIDKKITNQNGFINKIESLFDLSLKESVPLLLEKALQGVFIPIFLVLLIILKIVFWKEKDKYLRIVLAVIGAIVAYKLALVSLIQYEYRHMNAIYLFLLGGGFLFFQLKNKKITK
ncbi:hypothetical protein ACFLSQ_03770 [Bacteroidota bacterium]